MKVLVTGAHGFIGKRLVRTLLDANHEVVATRSTADTGIPRDWTEDVRVVPLELCSGESVASNWPKEELFSSMKSATSIFRLR